MKIQEAAAVRRLFGLFGHNRANPDVALQQLNAAVALPTEGTVYGEILQSKFLRPETIKPQSADKARIIAATPKTFADGDLRLNAAQIRVFPSCSGIVFVSTDFNHVPGVLVPRQADNVFDKTDLWISHTNGNPRNPGSFRAVAISAPSSKNATSLIIWDNGNAPPTIEQGTSDGPLPSASLVDPVIIDNRNLREGNDRFILIRVAPVSRPKGAIQLTVKDRFLGTAGNLTIPLRIPVVVKQ